MVPYISHPSAILKSISGVEIASFISLKETNIDIDTVDSFGDEWAEFNSFTENEIKITGDQYFDIVDSKLINEKTIVLDVGCGSGRWSKYLADKVGFIEAVDPSKAVYSASSFLANYNNIRITQASADNLPFEDNSFDFVFSLGVLHHIPNTQKALEDITRKAKKGAAVLIYLYYSLDDKPYWFRMIFKVSNVLRLLICKLPSKIKKVVCSIIAILVYMPFVFLARLVKGLLPNSKLYRSIPLSYYSDKSFYIINNDALDRFGTPLEQRFTKMEITTMMQLSGLEKIIFSDNMPYWHAIGFKK